MADQLPEWFTGGYGWDPSRLGEAETNTKYGIADWAIKNNVNLQNPDRDVAARIFEALKQRFPQLSLVNADTIDLGNGDGTIGVRPNDRNSNWDARQGQWNLSWIDPYHSNAQSNSAKLVSGQPAGTMPTYAGYQAPSSPPPTMTPQPPSADLGALIDSLFNKDKLPQTPTTEPPPWKPWHPWDPGPPPPFEPLDPSYVPPNGNTGVSGYGPGGIQRDQSGGMFDQTPVRRPYQPRDTRGGSYADPSQSGGWGIPNERRPQQPSPEAPGQQPQDPDIESIVQRALSRVML